MTKNEFLNTIYLESGFMLPEERREALRYFREHFVSGVDEEMVCTGLGEPKAALKQYIADGAVIKHGFISRLMMYAAAALASPAFIYGAVVVAISAIIIILFSLVLFVVLPFIGFELWLGGFEMFIGNMPQGSSFADMLCVTGFGLFTSAVGIFILLGVYKLYRRLIPWLFNELASSYRRIKRKLRRTITVNRNL